MKPMFSLLLAICSCLAFGLATTAQQTNQTAKASGTAQSTNEAANGSTEANSAPPPSAPAQRATAELEKIAMPIALHPDPLIAIILPASAYPVEIVQVARFIKDTNNIAKVDEQPWDENVKSLAKFPDVIAQMDKDLTWTIELGKAFVEQPKELMDTIQSLRAKAKQAGTLQSSPQQVVTVTNEVIMQTNVTQVVAVTNQVVQIQPSDPQIIYVPSYSSTVYYPPPAYVYNPYAPLVTFGVGMAMGAIVANNCDWHGGGVYVGPRGGVAWGGGGYHGDVDVDVDRNVNVNQNSTRNVNRSTTQSGNQANKAQQQKWQPNQARMQTSGATSAQSREARGWGDGSSASAQQTAAAGANRPSAGSGATRPTQPAAGAGSTRPSQPSGGTAANRPSQPPSASGGTRPSQPSASGSGASGGQRPAGSAPATRPSTPQQQPAASRPAPSAPASRPSGGQSASRPAPQSSPAFSGVNSGGGAQSSSSRGAASRGGGGGGRGGGGRGR